MGFLPWSTRTGTSWDKTGMTRTFPGQRPAPIDADQRGRPWPNVSVVLVEPSLPENVGAVARAMDNMGFDQLRLVRPCDHLGAVARRVATHSAAILDAAAVFDSLAEAVADHQVILGTTARNRETAFPLTPLVSISGLLPAEAPRVALVFGRESSGLENAELALCNGWLQIPTWGTRASLNLSHAVIVVLYELARQRPPAPRAVESPDLADSGEIEGLKRHLFAVLDRVRFLRTRNRESLWSGFSGLVGRARPTRREVRLLHGFFHRVQVTFDRERREGGSSPASRS